MHLSVLLAAVVASVGLAACNPALNWREVRADTTELVALLPCKPDRGARAVSLGGQAVQLQMAGCEAGGATFAVSHATLADGAQAQAALAQWREVTLKNLRAAPAVPAAARDVPFAPKGAMALPGSVRVTAQGQRPEGGAVSAQAVWFARATPTGVQIFHAVIYAERMAPEAAETFFAGLKFP